MVLAGAALAAAATSSLPPNPGLSRAQVLYNETDFAGAIEALHALHYKNAATYALLGKAYVMQGQYKEAVASLEAAVGEDGLNSDYCDWLGRAYGGVAESSSFLSAMRYAKKTVRAFERAVELDPSNVEALSDLFEYYLQAPGVVGGGVDKAERIARRVAVLDQAESHWMRARLAEKRKDDGTAEREYRSALAASPHQVGRTLDLARFLSSRGRYDESDVLFQSADDDYPNSPKVVFARASAYIESNRRIEEARLLIEKYPQLQKTPDDPTQREAAALLKRTER